MVGKVAVHSQFRSTESRAKYEHHHSTAEMGVSRRVDLKTAIDWCWILMTTALPRRVVELGKVSRGTTEAGARTPSAAVPKDSNRSGSALAAPMTLAAATTSLLRGPTFSLVADQPH